MDIIAAHQQGLIEQLEDNVRALAGRPRDHGQRAVVLHHLYDHSRGAHAWALVEARRELRVARALVALDRRLDRWGWMLAGKDQARAALSILSDAIGEASRSRCAAAYLAYRMSATAALRNEAAGRLTDEYLAALDQCHAARRSGETLAGETLAQMTEVHAAAAVDEQAMAAAWQAICATGLKRAARRLIGDKALARSAARDRRRGYGRIESDLRADAMLPAAFRANPAQHFYALQHALAERRRQQWREACDREPDAFELAA